MQKLIHAQSHAPHPLTLPDTEARILSAKHIANSQKLYPIQPKHKIHPTNEIQKATIFTERKAQNKYGEF